MSPETKHEQTDAEKIVEFINTKLIPEDFVKKKRIFAKLDETFGDNVILSGNSLASERINSYIMDEIAKHATFTLPVAFHREYLLTNRAKQAASLWQSLSLLSETIVILLQHRIRDSIIRNYISAMDLDKSITTIPALCTQLDIIYAARAEKQKEKDAEQIKLANELVEFLTTNIIPQCLIKREEFKAEVCSRITDRHSYSGRFSLVGEVAISVGDCGQGNSIGEILARALNALPPTDPDIISCVVVAKATFIVPDGYAARNMLNLLKKQSPFFLQALSQQIASAFIIRHLPEIQRIHSYLKTANLSALPSQNKTYIQQFDANKLSTLEEVCANLDFLRDAKKTLKAAAKSKPTVAATAPARFEGVHHTRSSSASISTTISASTPCSAISRLHLQWK